MLVVSFVVIGVAPRTLGRQHDERVALLTAGAADAAITRILGPLPRLLILVGNAITPGRGFREGPFSTETELRELVDLAEASAVIESGERKMIHSVFELGDTIAREVMVPRTDVVYIERHKNLRQTMSLFLRSGFSRIPVIGENLDDIVGFAYLKDIVRRDFEAPDVESTQRVEEVMRPVHFVPDSKPVDALLSRDAGPAPAHRGGRRRVRRHRRPGHHRGRPGGDRRRDHRRVRRRARSRSRPLDDGAVRVSSRYPVDDLDELFGIDVERRRRRQRRRADGQAPRPGADPRLRTSRCTACASRPRRPPAAATGSAPC